MADEPIETVAVRLLADARPLLEQTDDAVETVTEAVEEMGEAIEETLTSALDEGGKAIADFAEKFSLSIKQAMDVLKKTGDLDKFLESFSESDLLKAGEAIRGQIAEPMIEAATAAETFGETINVQVADLLHALEESDAIDEFLSGFSQAELDTIAQSIDQNVTDPLEVATRTFMELARMSGMSTGDLIRDFDEVGETLKQVFGSKEMANAMVSMGAAIERDLQIPIENAERAIIEFADSVGLSVRDVIEAFGGEGEMDEFLSKFSTEALEKMASDIQKGLVEPVIDATAGAIELNAQVGGIAGAVEGWVEPLDDAASTIERTVVPAGQKIEAGIIQPMSKAAEVTDKFGVSMDETMGQKVPLAIDKAEQEIIDFGKAADDAFSKLTVQAQAGDLEKSTIAIRTLLRDITLAAHASGESLEETAETWATTSRAMGLSAETLLSVVQGNYEPIQEIITKAGNTVADSMALSNDSLDETIEKLAGTARVGKLTVEGLRQLADVEKIIQDRTAKANEQLTILQELFSTLPTAMQEQFLPLLTEFQEKLSEGAILTEEEAGLLSVMTSEMQFQAEMFEVINPKIDEMVENLRELGVELNTLQINKLRDGAQAIGEASGDVKTATEEIGNYLDGQEKAIGKSKKLGDETDILSGFFQIFGGEAGGLASQLVNVATKAGLVLIAFQAIKKVVSIIKEAAQGAIELSESVGNLAVSLALQSAATGDARIGLNEMIGFADELADKFSLSRVAIIDASKALFLMNQQSKLTNEQILGLIQRGSAMAKLYSRDVTGTLVNLMNFIATGLRSGLEDFALDLDQLAIKTKAVDLGFSSNLKTLSETEMAYVRYMLVLEQTTLLEEAAASSIDTLADRMNVVEDRVKNASDALGNIFAPAIVAVKEQWADVVEGFVATIQIVLMVVLKMVSDVVASFMTMAATIAFFVQGIQDGAIPTMKELDEFVSKTFDTARTQLFQAGVDRMLGGMKDMEEGFDDLADAAGDAGDEIQDVTIEMADAFMDAANKFDEGMARIGQRFNDTMADISARFDQRRADAATDLSRDLRDIDANAAQRRMESIRDFQIAEIRMREDHQLEIRQLEENFVLNLQDAVRERDARGVLNLQRRFNMEKKHRKEDFNLNMKRLKENHSNELMEIDAQRQRRRAARLRQYQEELLDLELQEQRRREQAQLQRDRAERDLLDDIKRRLDLLAEGADAEMQIEAEKLRFLMDALNKAYGSNSFYEKMYLRAIAIAELAAARIAAANRRIFAGLPGLGGPRLEEEGDSRQRGGSVLATSPTQVMIGEGRPEVAQITPLSQATGAPSAGFRGGMAGGMAEPTRIELVVDASEKLLIEVADHTMSEVAEVVVTLNQRNGGGVRGG